MTQTFENDQKTLTFPLSFFSKKIGDDSRAFIFQNAACNNRFGM